MLKMMEFRIDLNGTAEERAEMEKTKGMSGISCVIEMPHSHTIRRLNTKILQHRRTGIHPQTKQMGTFVEQEEAVYLWAECEESNVKWKYKFFIIPTGAEIPKPEKVVKYVGTFFVQGGLLAFHVYGPVVLVD